ncbi:MAG: EF-P lysine aminoacylase GenX [Rhabdochlamydiaceae bacterium]|nr:EF-P lysine aminoacylase GenX [Candidatus Amphrikana amoebophyrae]
MSRVAKLIQERAKWLANVRSFFASRNILEVDTPSLSSYAALDPFIDPIQAENNFLHTSPEYRMKELLAQGCGDIYYLGHVFRKEEEGRLHSSEFTMIEYYRIGKSLNFLIEETLQLIQLFVPKSEVTKMSYDEAMAKYGQKCPEEGLTEQEQRHLIWATQVEPQFKGITIIDQFPKDEAALAKIQDGKAMRFEIYYNGVELANGYDELTSSKEQRYRFQTANTKRLTQNKGAFAIDESFLKALDLMPECVGVAIGFDRLLQIKMGFTTLQEVLY